MCKLGISGICGKMGQRIFELAKADGDFKIIVGLERKGHPQIGKAINGVRISDDHALIANCDCVIDFTAPAATLENLEHIVKFKKHAVIGTTGIDQAGQNKIKEASKKIPIVFSPNMSVGVNLLFRLTGLSAKILKNYKVYVEETHHVHKKDAPSGTARKITEILNVQGFNIRNEDVKVNREDEIVGDHRVVFESEGDRIELFHSAKTRDIFAKGALLAAKWVINKKPGLYSMNDILW